MPADDPDIAAPREAAERAIALDAQARDRIRRLRDAGFTAEADAAEKRRQELMLKAERIKRAFS